jgi:hypothetical protein
MTGSAVGSVLLQSRSVGRLPDHTGKFSQAAGGGHRDDPAARYFVTARSAAATYLRTARALSVELGVNGERATAIAGTCFSGKINWEEFGRSTSPCLPGVVRVDGNPIEEIVPDWAERVATAQRPADE